MWKERERKKNLDAEENIGNIILHIRQKMHKPLELTDHRRKQTEAIIENRFPLKLKERKQSRGKRR